MKNKFLSATIVFFLTATVSFLLLNCKNGDKPNEDPVSVNPPPPVLSHTILQTYPHDTSSYTQGLCFYKGEFFEGTGDPGYAGKSRLIKVDLKTGKALQSIWLSNKYFGEGITTKRYHLPAYLAAKRSVCLYT
jgi:glutaminyl-peptide cyclotransferase